MEELVMRRWTATVAVMAAAAIIVPLVGASPAVAGGKPMPAMMAVRAGHNAAETIALMTAHYRDPGLEVQNRPFALLYLRTTEGMRDANNAGEFSDPQFWDERVIPTFAGYYLDAYAAWKRGDHRDVDPAWRIAFQAKPEKLTCTQLLYLGINAHVNNDLAFVIEELGDRYLYPDHLHVDDVLAFRTRPVVYPEIQRDLCPGLFTETIPPTADQNIFAWRQLAWDNAQRLRSASTARERKVIARQIHRHAAVMAHEIIRWNR
jgi:hypothetical protein